MIQKRACPSGGATELTGAGATFPGPQYTRWFQVYANLCGAQISYQAIGSSGSITQHTQRTVQFGASDGIMTDAQRAAEAHVHLISSGGLPLPP